MLGYQAPRLADLRTFAASRSPFYRDLQRGLEAAPLAVLPVVTKATLMARFDDLATALGKAPLVRRATLAALAN